jgi:hypothetical protein
MHLKYAFKHFFYFFVTVQNKYANATAYKSSALFITIEYYNYC